MKFNKFEVNRKLFKFLKFPEPRPNKLRVADVTIELPIPLNSLREFIIDMYTPPSVGGACLRISLETGSAVSDPRSSKTKCRQKMKTGRLG